MSPTIASGALLLFGAFTMFITDSKGLTSDQLRTHYHNLQQTMDHFYSFNGTPLTSITNIKTNKTINITGTVTASQSPLGTQAISIRDSITRVDLNFSSESMSCFQDPFTCVSGLTVGMLLKVGSGDFTSQIFGPYDCGLVDCPGVRITFATFKLYVRIIGQNKTCSWRNAFPRYRWVYLVFTWDPLFEKLIVYNDNFDYSKHYSCNDHTPYGAAVENHYYLNSFSGQWLWYGPLMIWNSIITFDDNLEKVWDLMTTDNGGSTTIELLLNVPGQSWSDDYANSSSNSYIELKSKLITCIRPQQGTQGSSKHISTQLQSLSKTAVQGADIVMATVRVQYTSIDKFESYYLQKAIEEVSINNASLEIKGCTSDDNFFCEIPTLVALKQGSDGRLNVIYKANYTGIVENFFYQEHNFVYEFEPNKMRLEYRREGLYNINMTKVLAYNNLQPNTLYCVRIGASGFKSGGFFSKPKCIRTPESAPSAFPANITVFNKSSTSVNIAWSDIPQSHHNGIIRGYIISLYDNDTGNLVQNQIVCPSVRVIHLRNLKAYTKYNVKILAFNTLIGPYSPFIDAMTTESAPSAFPTNITFFNTSSTRLNVTWSDIPQSQQNGIIRGYMISLFDNSTGSLLQKKIICSIARHVHFSNLKPYSKYSVNVLGITNSNGPYSPLIHATTAESVPSVAPHIIEAHYLSYSSIHLRWNLTYGWDGVPSGFAISWGTSNQIIVCVNETSFNITDLEPFTMYHVRIRGATRVGFGKAVNLNVSTDEGPPSGFPTDIRLFNTSKTSLNVKWSDIPQSQHNGIIREYEISLIDVDENKTVRTTNVASTQREWQFDNLKSYYNYSVRIRGVTKVPGKFSPYVFARTDESVPMISPKNFRGKNLSSEILFVSWETMGPGDYRAQGVILGYVLRISWLDNDIQQTNRKYYICNNTKIIHNLWPYSLYNISVAGFNRVGRGPSSSLLLRTDGKAPSKPPSSVVAYNLSFETIRVEWKEINSLYTHGEILGYNTTIFETAAVSLTQIENAKARFTLFNGLKELTLYTINVLAYNRYGNGPAYVLFGKTRQSPPKQAPTSLKAWNTSSTSCIVTWQPVNHISVTGYSLTYTNVNNKAENDSIKTHNQTLEISKLNKYTLYNISVQAFNAEGLGPASESVFCLTEEDIPSMPPIDIQGFNTSKNTIFISWDPVPPDSANGRILGYYITYSVTNSTVDHSRRRRRSVNTGITTKVSVSHGNYTFTGLEPYTWYSVKIAAYTIKGTGKWSPTFYVRTEQEEPQIPPPSVSGYATSSTSINVTWKPILNVQVRGIMTSYVVRYVTLDNYGNVTATQQKYVPHTQLSIDLKGLKKYTNYSLTVSGVTKAVGNESQPIVVRTDEDTPDLPPQNIAITRNSHSSLKITWSPVPEPFVNGILSGYVLSYRKTDDVTQAKNVTLSSKNTSCVVTKLTPVTSYSFWMRGVTGVGPGVVSAEHLGTTDESVPDKPPGNITIQNLTSDRSIHVAWSPIHHDHVRGILLGYKVIYKIVKLAGGDVRSHDSFRVKVSSATTSLLTTNLDNFAVYEFKILGYTIKGDGAISEPVYGETCACTKRITTSYHVTSPYVSFNHTMSKPTGLIPTILQLIVDSCCGDCVNGHGKTYIDYHRDDFGNMAKKTNITKFLQNAAVDTDLSFPVNGFEGKTMHGGNTYVKLVTSPGVAFITVSKITRAHLSAVLFGAILNSGNVILLMLSMVWLVGILTWILDTRCNPEIFPPSFLKGAYNGCWMAFISITTLGYGDCVPKGIAARIVTIANALMGFVLIALITANLSNDLVVTTVTADQTNLYNAKIGAIKDSFEYRVGIRRNAKVEKDYHSFEELRQAMISHEVDGILVDLYVSADHQELFDLPGLTATISKLLKYDNIYGVSLGGRSKKLQGCFNDYINFERKTVFKIIESGVSQPEVPDKNAAQVMSSGLIDPNSDLFQFVVKYAGGAILVCNGIALLVKVFGVRRRSVSPDQGPNPRATMIKEMTRIVKVFYNTFSQTYQEMRASHQKERRNLFKVRNEKYLSRKKYRVN